MTNSSPGVYTKKFVHQMKSNSKPQRLQGKKPRAKRTLVYTNTEPDEHYGPDAAQLVPDITDDEMNTAREQYLKKLKEECSQEFVRNVEISTRNQSSSHEWRDQRRKRLTASYFGKICKMRASTSCSSVVESIRYPTFYGNDSTRWGIENESVAIQSVSEELGVQVDKCGLFINTEYPYLGASPDGLIADGAIVEIKCPASIKDMAPEEAYEAGKVTFLHRKDGTLRLKENHAFFYQIQGQLNITGRDLCYFAVWTPKGKNRYISIS